VLFVIDFLALRHRMAILASDFEKAILLSLDWQIRG
jgi:hypothetical protein